MDEEREEGGVSVRPRWLLGTLRSGKHQHGCVQAYLLASLFPSMGLREGPTVKDLGGISY